MAAGPIFDLSLISEYPTIRFFLFFPLLSEYPTIRFLFGSSMSGMTPSSVVSKISNVFAQRILLSPAVTAKVLRPAF